MIRFFAAGTLLLAAMAALAEDPPATPEKEKEVDVAKTTEKVVQDAKEAGKRLADKDSGDDTQQIQKNILKNLDDLLRKANQPPPMGGGGGGNSSSSQSSSGSSQQRPMGSSQQPMGGSSQQRPMGGSSTQPKGGSPQQQPMEGGSSSAAQQRKERREKNMAKGNQPQSNQQPSPLNDRADPLGQLGNSASSPNQIIPKGKPLPPRLADVYKDVWGQLPEKMRQEMDLYFREDFTPRYSELLRQYYSSLAERSAKSKP